MNVCPFVTLSRFGWNGPYGNRNSNLVLIMLIMKLLLLLIGVMTILLILNEIEI